MIRRAFVRALSGAILTTLLGVKAWRLEAEWGGDAANPLAEVYEALGVEDSGAVIVTGWYVDADGNRSAPFAHRYRR